MASACGATRRTLQARPPGPRSWRPSQASKLLIVAIALACAHGIPAALAQEWSDPTGDVTLPNSDVFCGAAIVDGETLHLFARFAAVPMSAQNHEVAWIIDADQDSLTGDLVGLAPGTDRVVKLDWNYQASAVELWFRGDDGWVPLDIQMSSNYDGTNPLVHVFLPLDVIEDDGAFDYILTSTFGGSFGANEWAPQPFSFTTPGQHFTSTFGEPVACESDVVPPPPPKVGEVEIEALIDEVEQLLADGILSQGHAGSLISKLEAALEQVRMEHPITATKLHLAFINEVEALVRAGIVPEAPGIPLIDSAQEIVDLLLSSMSESRFQQCHPGSGTRNSVGRLHGGRRGPIRPGR